jgi:hypothetical protein
MPFSSVLGASSVIKPGVCTSTTRPTVPYEGQLIYETDTDRVASYNGSAWVYTATGAVVQVKSTTKTDTFTTTSATYTDITGLSVSITPTSTSSRILVIATVVGGGQTSTTQGFGQLVRNSTAIGVGDASGSRVQATFPMALIINAFSIWSLNATFLDSPAATSATTYKIQIRNESGSGTVYVNRSENDANSGAGGRYISTITAFEVLA